MKKIYNRILIVRLSALGDAALTLPLLFALRMKMPAADIGWVVDETVVPLLEGLPQLNRIHVWKKRERNLLGLWRLAREIHSEGYELSIDTQGLARSAVLPFCAKIPERVGFMPAPLEGRELSSLLTNRRVSPPAELTHVCARTLYLGRALGLDMPLHMPVQLPRKKGAEIKMENWWEENRLPSRTMIFGIGAGWPTKMWPVKEMAVLPKEAEKTGFQCVVLWGPYEKHRIGEWRTLLGDTVLWAPPTDIHEMIALLRLCKRYAGPDSAALHLAWLLGKPTFSWFGASDPARCAPYGTLHAFVAKGPHTWSRKESSPTGLQTLTGEEAVVSFKKWLTQ